MKKEAGLKETFKDDHFCGACGLPGEHSKDECFDELVKKREKADAMFDQATHLLIYLGDPTKIVDKKLQDKVVALDVATWRYAV